MKAEDFDATWRTLSHKVLASPLIDHGSVLPIMDVLGTSLHWFPSEDRSVWAGICACVEAGVPPTVEAVAARCSAPPAHIDAIRARWTDEDNRRVHYASAELKRFGALAQVHELGQELTDADDPQEVEAMVDYAEARLSGILAETSDRKGDAKSVSDRTWAYLEQMDASRFIPTGLTGFDTLTGGLYPGLMYLVTGAYKSGKTNCASNALLNGLEAGVGADVFSADESAEMFTLRCQSMIATRLLITEKGIAAPGDLRLSSLLLMRIWSNGRGTLRDYEKWALAEARRKWARYNVRVWDSKDGIRNLATLRHRVRQSKLEAKSTVFWLDYAQRFNPSGGTLYERMSELADVMHAIARTEDVAVCILSQRNEAAIRSSDSYSTGVKGGGDLSAAVDFELLPKVETEDEFGNLKTPEMRVRLAHSRWTPSGSEWTHRLWGSCGLIADDLVAREPEPEF